MSHRRLEDLLTRRSLEELADKRSFARGLAYFEQGAVEHLQQRKHRLSASVLGTHLYSVELWPGQRSLRWQCSCPVGEEGDFCKHAVAAGLAWLDSRVNGARGASEFEAIEAFVKAADRQTLAELLLEHAEEDKELASRLLAAAQRASPLEQARAGGCSAGLWLQIAKAIEKESASDAIAIYQEQIEPIGRMKNNDAYDEAVELVGRIGELLKGSGRAAEFAGFVEELGDRHKAKRNFLQRLERVAK